MMRGEFGAMGTRVVALGGDPGPIAQLFAAAEAVFSRFDGSSELNRLNDHPSRQVAVSETLAACLRTAADLRARTAGLVDPAVGNAVVGWGYARSFETGLNRLKPAETAQIEEWSIAGNVVTRTPGTQLDLGGLAKGWTADLAVEQGLARVVSAGGDVRSVDATTSVAIVDPWGQLAAEVQLGIGALATSSSTRVRLSKWPT